MSDDSLFAPADDLSSMGHPLVQDLLLRPAGWKLWPALAVLRWMQRQMRQHQVEIAFRSRPTLSFAASEIEDVSLRHPQRVELTVNALGLASAGSALPGTDAARIIADSRGSGALSFWLDMVTDRLFHAAEASLERSSSAFACATGARTELSRLVPAATGYGALLDEDYSGTLSAGPRSGARRLDGLGAVLAAGTTAHGLARAFEAHTGLCARVSERTGARIEVARPARIGAPLGRILGAEHTLDECGVTIRLNDGDRCEDARRWVQDRHRAGSLHELARACIGEPLPLPSIEVSLPSAKLQPAVWGLSMPCLGAVRSWRSRPRPVRC